MRKRQMNSGGQTTIFIILSIVIIVGIVIFFLLKTFSDQENLGIEYFKQQGLEPSLKNIQNFVVDCLEITAKESLIKIGIQGGYYNKPANYFDMQWAFIPYYYDNGKILHPKKEQIEKELSSYINNNLESCISEIDFKNFELKFESPLTKSTIDKSSVKFTTKFPLIIEHGGNSITFDLDNYPISINSSLYNIIELADYITESHKENKDLMCINCITEMAKRDKLYVDFISFEKDTTLVMILENKTMEQPYIFEFLNRYDTA